MTRSWSKEVTQNHSTAYLAIGKVAVSWAHIEYELELCVSLIYSHCEGKLLNENCPMNFQRKLKIFRWAFESEKRLSDLKSDGSKIADAMSSFADYRNQTLHGTIAFFNRSEVVFDKHEFGGRIPKPSRRTVPVAEIEKNGQEMEDFSFELGYFTSQFEEALRSTTSMST